ncbi:MAG: FAD-binding protein [Candidatus Rokubacteria bacterium]|nr:FAD-binding protein [Candidatus Rokubacteria bacterium]
MDTIDADVLVLGAGGAGLCAALHAADASPHLRVAVVVKGLLGRAGCTRMVQGGYNAVLAAPDSLEAHLLDTLAGGGWINDQELVWTLVTESPGRVLELESRYGCLFDRTPEGRIHQKPFAGQSHDRTVHKGDLTGIEIMSRLTEQVLARANIRVLEDCRAVDLVRDDAGRAAGALVLDLRSGRFLLVRARATLLAMGGGPTMYRVIACSADKSADGIALAYRAGLRNGGGERFMARYDPARLERSTRDLVSRASFLEVTEGRGTPNGGVWIDVSHLGAETVERTFRGMVKRCRDFGRDLAREPVEVAPTAHFMMGGVVIDPSCRTAIEGLFAAGEDTGGVHGANRLGGNGVGESTVFGGIAGDVMAAFVEGRPSPRVSSVAAEPAMSRAEAPLARPFTPALYDLQRRLREVMWDRVGLVRDGDGLATALAEIEAVDGALRTAGVGGGRALSTAWQDWLNLDSQVIVARLIAASALARRESRGAHWRRDFPAPAPGPPFSVHVRLCNGLPTHSVQPVVLTRARPDTVATRAAIEVGD